MGALDHPQAPKAEAATSRSVLQDFVAQHLASGGRNTADAGTDNRARANDHGGNKTAQAITALDRHMQQEIAAGKTPTQAEIKRSEQLHHASRGYTAVDGKMDKDAINQDPTDANGERAAIKSDQNVLKLKGISPELRTAVQADLAQKKGLLANETGDTSDESRYLRHDHTADAAGARLDKALHSHNPAEMRAALAADAAAQRTKGADYRADDANERGYVSADELNNRQNAILQRELAKDPYSQKALRGH